jgi:hypothetical protein
VEINARGESGRASAESPEAIQREIDGLNGQLERVRAEVDSYEPATGRIAASPRLIAELAGHDVFRGGGEFRAFERMHQRLGLEIQEVTKATDRVVVTYRDGTTLTARQSGGPHVDIEIHTPDQRLVLFEVKGGPGRVEDMSGNSAARQLAQTLLARRETRVAGEFEGVPPNSIINMLRSTRLGSAARGNLRLLSDVVSGGGSGAYLVLVLDAGGVSNYYAVEQATLLRFFREHGQDLGRIGRRQIEESYTRLLSANRHTVTNDSGGGPLRPGESIVLIPIEHPSAF